MKPPTRSATSVGPPASVAAAQPPGQYPASLGLHCSGLPSRIAEEAERRVQPQSIDHQGAAVASGPAVGHHMWNGLDDNDQRAVAAIAAFLQDTPAPLPNYPTRSDIAAFLRDHK
ncbi:hypothetical protein [Kitasatospora sp. GP82]|uniref:hypothetical protein n=1 Tax=Kitasatospora sp. GP82 TaxID=3035089 RepID=UPI0024751756|nr:hypothetical protein [Kitasatospora sp. GP82]